MTLWKPGQDLPDETLFALVMAWRLEALQHNQVQVCVPFWALDRLLTLAEKGANG